MPDKVLSPLPMECLIHGLVISLSLRIFLHPMFSFGEFDNSLVPILKLLKPQAPSNFGEQTVSHATFAPIASHSNPFHRKLLKAPFYLLDHLKWQDGHIWPKKIYCCTTHWINWSLAAKEGFLADQEWIITKILYVKGLQSLLESFPDNKGKPK